MVISARIDIAISSGVMAPRSSPAGALTRSTAAASDAAGHELFAQRHHLAAAADEGVILGLDGERRAQGSFIALALGRDHDETPGFVEVAGCKAVDDDMGVGLGGDIGGRCSQRDVIAELAGLRGQRHRNRACAEDH